jgi:hypothetical protein
VAKSPLYKFDEPLALINMGAIWALMMVRWLVMLQMD